MSHAEQQYVVHPLMEENIDDANLRRRKEWWIFLAFLVAAFVGIIVCLILIFTKPSIESQAFNGLIGLISWMGGYYLGKK